MACNCGREYPERLPRGSATILVAVSGILPDTRWTLASQGRRRSRVQVSLAPRQDASEDGLEARAPPRTSFCATAPLCSSLLFTVFRSGFSRNDVRFEGSAKRVADRRFAKCSCTEITMSFRLKPLTTLAARRSCAVCGWSSLFMREGGVFSWPGACGVDEVESAEGYAHKHMRRWCVPRGESRYDDRREPGD
jgi:hypothetical protein